MKIGIKICGMREHENIETVSRLQPDYMGFIFYADSPRFVPVDFVLPSIPSSVKRVGVFVDEELDKILALVREHSLDFVQLHGNESVSMCERIKAEGVSLIKTFSVSEQFDFDSTVSYKHIVDFFLFDTKGKYHGGNAISFDWSLLKKYDQEIPFFLSGGLSLKNIQDVSRLKEMNIHAIDINSGVEDKPGLKNLKLIQEIMSNLNYRV